MPHHITAQHTRIRVHPSHNTVQPSHKHDPSQPIPAHRIPSQPNPPQPTPPQPNDAKYKPFSSLVLCWRGSLFPSCIREDPGKWVATLLCHWIWMLLVSFWQYLGRERSWRKFDGEWKHLILRRGPWLFWSKPSLAGTDNHRISQLIFRFLECLPVDICWTCSGETTF